MKLGYQPHIDGLRAIAVISVLLFHVDFTFISGGYVGVDIFFVISGFLITRIIINEIESTGSFSFKRFYLRRFRRLMPAYFVVAAVTTLFATLLFSPGLLQSYGESLVASLLSISNIHFWLESDYFDTSNNLKPLLHTWSLSVEEQFYIFWPITLLAIYKLGSKKWLVPTLFLMVIVSLFLNVMFADGYVNIINQLIPSFAKYIENGSSTIFYNLPFRVFEFAIGAMLVLLPTFKTGEERPIKLSRWHFDVIFVLGLGLIGYSLSHFTEHIVFPSFNALIPCLGTALIIYAGGFTRFSVLLTNKVMLFIGVISYSLYLVHWPIIVFYKYLLLGQELTIAGQASAMIMSVVLGYVSYRLVETPFRTFRKNQPLDYLFPFRVRWLGLFVFILLNSMGIYLFKNQGLPWRIEKQVEFAYSGSAKDFHIDNYGGAKYPRYGGVQTSKPPEIIILGDSHGRHYAEGFYKEIALQHDATLYIAAGTSCFHLPSFTRDSLKSNYDVTCPESLKKAFRIISQAESPPIVVLSHSWWSQTRFAYKLDLQGERLPFKAELADIKNGIKKLKQQIGDSQLIIVGQVPTTGQYNLYELFNRPWLQ